MVNHDCSLLYHIRMKGQQCQVGSHALPRLPALRETNVWDSEQIGWNQAFPFFYQKL